MQQQQHRHKRQRLLNKEEGVATVHTVYGCRVWLLGGLRHRDDGPAVVGQDGRQEWWRFGKRHRGGDLPAVVVPLRCMKQWWTNGCLNRLNDQPAVVTDTERQWFKDGNLHRDGDKPAVVRLVRGQGGVTVAVSEWWVDGRRHRVHGPAISAPPVTLAGAAQFYDQGRPVEPFVWPKRRAVWLAATTNNLPHKDASTQAIVGAVALFL